MPESPAPEVERMARTIYRVEGTPSGDPSPRSASSDRDPVGQTFAGLSAAQAIPARKITRRKLFWVLLVMAILTVAMIVVIAALGASESPAVGTAADLASLSTVTYVPTTSAEPAGTSTTMAAIVEPPNSTTSSSGSTTTTLLTHAISAPVRVVIPALKVNAPTVAVGLVNGTEMQIPAVGFVGWYKLGAAPGASGPSVLVSHVSWNGEKGVFYNLKNLKPGDEVQVYDASGDCAVFQVDSSETILKSNLPTERIWNETDQAVIRLVTCGGKYDSKTGHYLSNVIVYGHLVK